MAALSAGLLIILLVFIAGASAQDCRLNRAGIRYTGNFTTTTNGCTCRPWTDPVNSKYTDVTFPDGSRAAAGNRCRNPGVVADRPWCYIVPATCPAFAASNTFDFCDGIPVCSKTCRETATGTEYNGPVGVDSSGNPCVPWNALFPTTLAHFFTADAIIPGSVCRNIPFDVTNPSSTNLVPWCIVNVGGTPTPSNCSIPFCSQVNPGGCRNDQLGTSYRGIQSTSITGKPCIRWDASTIFNAGNWPVVGETIAAAANRCRNPNNSPVGLWCLVSSTDWEPCSVPASIPINGCPNNQSESYRYKDSISFTGCTTWSSLYASRSATWYNSRMIPPTSAAVNQPLFHPAILPDITMGDAAAFCRNPDNDINGPWCPTFAGTKQYCSNPCFLTPCLTDTAGLYYAGTVSTTRLNVTCQAWVSRFPVSHDYATTGFFPDGSAELARNYCRSPDQNRWGPWCYKSTFNGTGLSWDYCNVPFCPSITTPVPTASSSTDNCLRSTSGTEYAVTMATSKYGRRCITWTSNTALHPYYLPQMFNAATMSQVSNFCRNPDASATGPWCFVDATTRENCNIPMCSSAITTTAPSTRSDPSIIVATGIIGMLGLTTMLGLTGALLAARQENPVKPQDSHVKPHVAYSQALAPLRPLPAVPAAAAPIFTDPGINLTTEEYDTVNDKQQQAAMQSSVRSGSSGGGGNDVYTSGGGSGGAGSFGVGGYLVPRIITKPAEAAGGIANGAGYTESGRGGYSSAAAGGRVNLIPQSNSSSQSAALRGGSGSFGYGGGSDGGGYDEIASAGGGGGDGAMIGGESSYMEYFSSSARGGGDGGGGGHRVSSSSSSRYAASVSTRGGGGATKFQQGGSAGQGFYAFYANGAGDGIEVRQPRNSIVDEALSSYLTSGRR